MGTIIPFGYRKDGLMSSLFFKKVNFYQRINLKTNNLILFLIPTLIWGSTWFIITFQLGVTDPILAVSARFGLAGLILLLYCVLFKYNLSFRLKDHLFMGMQGLFLFGFNYLFVYLAENYITSGLVAASFSTLIFLNIVFAAIILKQKINKRVVIGAAIGLIGIVLIFMDEFTAINTSTDTFKGIIFCIIAIILASLGNITSAYNQREKLPVIQTNLYGMIYGAIALLLVALIKGSSFEFDTSWPFILSLLYLAIFGSIIAFWAYLKLIGNIGPDKAAYVIVVIPIIALILSSIYEGLSWTITTVIGTVLILVGNLISLKRQKKIDVKR